jgi:hypothetical protein
MIKFTEISAMIPGIAHFVAKLSFPGVAKML